MYEQERRGRGPDASTPLAPYSHGSMARPEQNPIGPRCTTPSVFVAHECNPIPTGLLGSEGTSVFRPPMIQSVRYADSRQIDVLDRHVAELHELQRSRNNEHRRTLQERHDMRNNNGIPMATGDPQRTASWAGFSGIPRDDPAPPVNRTAFGGPGPSAQDLALAEMQARVEELTSQLARLTTTMQNTTPVQPTAPQQQVVSHAAPQLSVENAAPQPAEPAVQAPQQAPMLEVALVAMDVSEPMEVTPPEPVVAAAPPVTMEHLMASTVGHQQEVLELRCPICAQSYKHGDAVLRLACGHMFHTLCNDQWISTLLRTSTQPETILRCASCRGPSVPVATWSFCDMQDPIMHGVLQEERMRFRPTVIADLGQLYQQHLI